MRTPVAVLGVVAGAGMVSFARGQMVQPCELSYDGCDNEHLCKCRDAWNARIWSCGKTDMECQCPIGIDLIQCQRPVVERCSGNAALQKDFQGAVQVLKDAKCDRYTPLPCIDNTWLHYGLCDNEYLCKCRDDWNAGLRKCQDTDMECQCPVAVKFLECQSPEVSKCNNAELRKDYQEGMELVKGAGCKS